MDANGHFPENDSIEGQYVPAMVGKRFGTVGADRNLRSVFSRDFQVECNL